MTLNGKKHLTQYYVGQVWRFTGEVRFFLRNPRDCILCTAYRIYTIGITNYLVAIPFFIPSLISQIPTPYFNLADQMQTAPMSRIFSKTQHVRTIRKIIFHLFLGCHFTIAAKIGLNAIVWVYFLRGFSRPLSLRLSLIMDQPIKI